MLREVAEELGLSAALAAAGRSSIRLRELIRAVRACKTAAEERDVIAKESAALREAFKDQDSRYRHRNVAKLMYIHMLGYPTHFGQMETLKLIAANGFPEKRIGYLGLMILLDERHEVLMLVTNSLKMDLNNHKNQYIVGLALAALGNICSAEMARDLAPDVERLLEDANPYIRKKAALCAIRVLKKNPELVEEFADKAAELLHDKNHAVLLSGVTLMLAICHIEPAVVDKYRAHVPMLCKVLRSLLQGGFSPEHDVGGITDPFLQVKILQLLHVLGRGNADASDQMTDILAQVAANVEGNRNAGNAILYEAVNTIMGIETIGGLRVMAVNILGRFLSNRDNNIRYVALNTLAKVVAVDKAAVQRHRATIVDCVKDADVSIRRRALELVYALVNESNIRPLTRELLDYLAVCDPEFRPDLTAKVASLVQRYAPDKRWHIDQLVAVMSQAGTLVKEQVVRALVVLVTNAPELHAYAARSAARALQRTGAAAETSLLTWALWTVGEFGEALPGPGAAGGLLEGEEPLPLSEADVVALVEGALRRPKAPAAVREVALTALAKLSARLPGQVPRIRALIERYRGSALLEVQARSCEFGRIFAHDALRPELLERMPALDEAEYARTMGGGAIAAGLPSGAAPAGGDLLGGEGDAAAAGGGGGGAGPAGDDLVDLLGGLDAASAAVRGSTCGGGAAAGGGGGVLGLDDLLGGGGGDLGGSSGGGGGSGGGIMDLLGGGGGDAGGGSGGGGLDDLLGGGLAPPPAAPPAAPAASASAGGAFPPIVAFEKDGLRVGFAFSKPAPEKPGLTTITATYTNSSLDDIEGFLLSAAVPRYMQMRLEGASGASLPAMGGSMAQEIHVINSMHGQKALALRGRIAYRRGGQEVEETFEVTNFPPGL